MSSYGSQHSGYLHPQLPYPTTPGPPPTSQGAFYPPGARPSQPRRPSQPVYSTSPTSSYTYSTSPTSPVASTHYQGDTLTPLPQGKGTQDPYGFSRRRSSSTSSTSYPPQPEASHRPTLPQSLSTPMPIPMPIPNQNRTNAQSYYQHNPYHASTSYPPPFTPQTPQHYPQPSPFLTSTPSNRRHSTNASYFPAPSHHEPYHADTFDDDEELEESFERRYAREKRAERKVERRPTLGDSVLGLVGKVGGLLGSDR